MIDSTRKRREQAQKDRVRRRINTKIDPENYEFRPAKKQVDYYDNEVEQRVAVYARVSTGKSRISGAAAWRHRCECVWMAGFL